MASSSSQRNSASSPSRVKLSGQAASPPKRPMLRFGDPWLKKTTGYSALIVSMRGSRPRRMPAHSGVNTGPATTISPPACSATQRSSSSICTSSSFSQSGSKATMQSYWNSSSASSGKFGQDVGGFLGGPGAAGLQQHVERDVPIAEQLIAQELVLAARAARHEQHARLPLDDRARGPSSDCRAVPGPVRGGTTLQDELPRADVLRV